MKPLWIAVVVLFAAAVLWMTQKLDTIEQRVTKAVPANRGPAPPVTVEGGAAIYVPAYSHILRDERKPVLLKVTLSVRNVDPERPVTIKSVRYFDTTGHEVRSLLTAPRELGPFETAEFHIPRRDVEGGSGANFLVEWDPTGVRNPPLAQAVMVGFEGQQSVSFQCEGRAVDISTRD